jgi:hypothetical protein
LEIARARQRECDACGALENIVSVIIYRTNILGVDLGELTSQYKLLGWRGERDTSSPKLQAQHHEEMISKIIDHMEEQRLVTN